MAEKNRPVADILALIETTGHDGKKRTIWIPLGALFENRDLSLSGEMHAEPIQWQKVVPRQIQIRWRDDRHKEARAANNDGRQGYGQEDGEDDDIPY